jgi:hypothetical protein
VVGRNLSRSSNTKQQAARGSTEQQQQRRLEGEQRAAATAQTRGETPSSRSSSRGITAGVAGLAAASNLAEEEEGRSTAATWEGCGSVSGRRRGRRRAAPPRSRTRSRACGSSAVEDEVAGGVRFSTVRSLGSDEAEDGAPVVGEVVAGGDSRGSGSRRRGVGKSRSGHSGEWRASRWLRRSRRRWPTERRAQW